MSSAFALLAFSLGPSEMIVILVVGLLVFGRRLPEVGRQFGRTFLEFRKGLNSFRNQIDLDEDVRETRSTMRELQREITRPMEVQPWTRSRPVVQVEPQNEELDHGPLADQGGAHAIAAPTEQQDLGIPRDPMGPERAEDDPPQEPPLPQAESPDARSLVDEGAPFEPPRSLDASRSHEA
jgi:sec-independent protein translocase protein TatA